MSVTSRSNCSRLFLLVWALWSEAWSSVAVSNAFADAALSRFAIRTAGAADDLKRVITSRVLCCLTGRGSAITAHGEKM